MFSEEQKQMMLADLPAEHVKQRKQAGLRLSYIENWKAIEEANRIFGFDGWSSETMLMEQICAYETTIGEAKIPGWTVSYRAKVMVTAGGVMREGCGVGHGIDRNMGQAHEGAIKEAESDAQKRALRTFGYRFGLALYDKTQEHVAECNKIDEQTKAAAFIKKAQEVAPGARVVDTPKTAAPVDDADRIIGGIMNCKDAAGLEAYTKSDSVQATFKRLPREQRARVSAAKKEKVDSLGAE